MKHIRHLIELLAIDLESYYQKDTFYDFKVTFLRMNIHIIKLELAIGRYDSIKYRVEFIKKTLFSGGIINSNVYKIETELNFLSLSRPDLFPTTQETIIPIYNAGD